MRLAAAVVALILPGLSSFAASLPEPAAALLAHARSAAGERARLADRIGATAIPSQDGRSFAVVWSPPTPRGWIVTLHGSASWAFDEIALWHPSASDRNLGIVAWQ